MQGQKLLALSSECSVNAKERMKQSSLFSLPEGG